MRLNTLLKSKFGIPIVLGLLILLFYSNTLQNGFVHDDIWQVQENQNIKSFNNLGNILSGCIAQEMLGGCKNIGFYFRPLQSVGYLITSQISQSPSAFHFFNLIYLFLASFLVYILFKLLKLKPIFALIGAVLFIVSPVNSEVVNWVSAIPELFLVGFIILSLILYIKYLSLKKLKFLLLSITAFFLALLSKETAIFFVTLLPLYSIIFGQKSKNLKSFYPLLWFLLPIGLYLFIRSQVLGRVVYKYEGYYSLDLISQILTALSLYPKYLIKLIYPLPLSFQPLIMPKIGFDLEVLIGAGFLIGTLGLFYLFWVKKMHNLLFGLLIVVLGIFPVLLFVNKLGEFIFSERYLLFSSVGFSLIVVEVVNGIIKKPKSNLKKVLIFLLFLYIIFSFVIVFQRNKDWKDNFVSYQAMIKVDPNHKKAHLQLGELYKGMGEMDLAKVEYLKALEIDPNYTEASIAASMVANSYSKGDLSFYYSRNWIVNESTEGINLVLKTDKEELQALIKQESSVGFSNLDEYLLIQTDSFGKIASQGLARIPNVDLAYVKLWDDQGIQKLQFFLFKNNKVAKILVFPADSKLMKEFDSVLGTISIK